MNTYTLVNLNRKEYLDSIETLQNDKSIKFAKMALTWWDKLYGWYIKGCIALTDESNQHLCYIFFKVDKCNEYMTIHNIFTPEVMRRNGYAHILMSMIFQHALDEKVSRFRLTCISKSLDFYLSLGFIYWGVNSVGDYYCDLPMPESGLQGVKSMTQNFTTSELIGSKMQTIYKKIQQHSTSLTEKQQLVYDKDILKLDKSYRQNSFFALKDKL